MASNGNNPRTTFALAEAPRRRSSVPILILAVLFCIAAFLTWYFTWFGRGLTDPEITKFLADEKHPRHVQHALLQIQQQMEKGAETARQWYPAIINLAGSPQTEYRLTVAWLMGFDQRSEEFHQALLKLLKDPEPMVRRNASLALVRFNDSSGRQELRATLRPYDILAPAAGTISSTLNAGSKVSRGSLLARIVEPEKGIVEIRSPLPGRVEQITAINGKQVSPGAVILAVNSDADSIWEALRGLALIGRSEDLADVERFAQGSDSAQIKQQAQFAARAIRSRAK